MDKWEYGELVKFNDEYYAFSEESPFDIREVFVLIDALNRLGEIGWELASTVFEDGEHTHILKRKIQKTED